MQSQQTRFGVIYGSAQLKTANKNNQVFVTKPSLPPLGDLIPMLEEIWDSRALTNSGKFHQALERELAAYLGVENISLVTNGTLALMVALKALDLKGEVITTPFTFAATAHALKWCGLEPVFVDIDPETFNLDPSKIEAAVTSRTSAVLPVHCYGYACDTRAIATIASRHNLKVLYDGSHAFGVDCDCGSLLTHGNATTLSFHATKIFNTFEGGAIVSESPAIKESIDSLRNFGYENEISFRGVGTNAKMNEFSAALGLLQLRTIDQAISNRQALAEVYRRSLEGCPGIDLPAPPELTRSNIAYFPVLVNGHCNLGRDGLYEFLKQGGIHTRRYFYPLVSDCNGYESSDAFRQSIPNAVELSEAVLCLPMYQDLEESDINRICEAINKGCSQ